MANKPGTADFFPEVPSYPSMGTFQPVYGKFDLTTYIQGASDYEIMAFLVGKYNACLEAYETVTKLSTDTITAAHQLQDWINSWFDNLDVQQELNNKIDSMVADGSFGTLLHQTFDAQINQQTTSAVTAWLVANVDPKGSAVVVDSSLSITGAAADARVTGKGLSHIAIASAATKLDVTFEKTNDTTITFNVKSDPGHFIWSENQYVNTSNLTTSCIYTFNPDTFSGATIGLYWNATEKKLEAHAVTDIAPAYSILIWAGFFSNTWRLNFVVFNATTMALNASDKTLSISNAKADAREAGFRDSRIAIASTLTKLNVTLEKDGNIGKIILDTDQLGSSSGHFVWSEHAYINMSAHIPERTATYIIPDNFTGFTAGLYADLDTDTLVITPITSYQNQNSILLWAGFIGVNWTRNLEVFNAYSMVLNHFYSSTDTTLSTSDLPADAKVTGRGLSHIAIASTTTKLDVTFEKTNDKTITFNVESDTGRFIWSEHQFVNTSNLTTSCIYTFNPDTFSGATIGLYWNATEKKLEAHAVTDIVPAYSILIWAGYFGVTWSLILVVFNAKTMALNKLYDAIPVAPDTYFKRLDMVGGNCASIFTKVVCCGDSYTSGHITTSTGTIDTNEAFAWPKYAAQITGNEYINCGRSGANVLTWQTATRGLTKAKTSGVAQCYIIGLGLNDIATGTSRYVELGTSADIGTDAETYYGGYSKIIRELHEISPNAVIFCQTMPMASGLKLQYNEAIRTIVSQYASEYNAKLLNLNDYDDYYRKTTVSQNVSGGHYTAAGYQQLAQILCYAISDYVNAHTDEFKDINRVPYDDTNVATLSIDNEQDEVFGDCVVL